MSDKSMKFLMIENQLNEIWRAMKQLMVDRGLGLVSEEHFKERYKELAKTQKYWMDQRNSLYE